MAAVFQERNITPGKKRQELGILPVMAKVDAAMAIVLERLFHAAEQLHESLCYAEPEKLSIILTEDQMAAVKEMW